MTCAQREIKDLLPNTTFEPLESSETFLLRTPVDLARATATLTAREPIFLRHVHPVDTTIDTVGTATDLDALRSWAAELQGFPHAARVAVQARREPGLHGGYTTYGIKEAIDEVLVRRFDAKPVVQRPDWVVSVYCTGGRAFVGLSRARDNLSDWSGGAVRFKKEPGQISRAVFKLLEAEIRFRVDLSRFRHALDLGAAPGGWTAHLLDRGVRVTAVDPAVLHPDLRGRAHLVHLPSNAAQVSFPSRTFDLLVCDMSRHPKRTAMIVRNLASTLHPRGKAIVTVKLVPGDPLHLIRSVEQSLAPRLRLQQAKQLYHNRKEVTLYLERVTR